MAMRTDVLLTVFHLLQFNFSLRNEIKKSPKKWAVDINIHKRCKLLQYGYSGFKYTGTYIVFSSSLRTFHVYNERIEKNLKTMKTMLCSTRNRFRRYFLSHLLVFHNYIKKTRRYLLYYWSDGYHVNIVACGIDNGSNLEYHTWMGFVLIFLVMPLQDFYTPMTYCIANEKTINFWSVTSAEYHGVGVYGYKAVCQDHDSWNNL